jgi:hypothetical protein
MRTVSGQPSAFGLDHDNSRATTKTTETTSPEWFAKRVSDHRQQLAFPLACLTRRLL